MGKVKWEVREDIHEAYDTIPALSMKSRKDFRPPPTIESDFQRLLMHDVPHVNFTFELIHNWYDREKEDYEPVFIRAQQTPIDWKSKIGNSDMSNNFKVDHSLPIHKGDMALREDGKVFILNWNIQLHPNNQATQSLECNTMIQVSRYRHEQTDDRGKLVETAGGVIVAHELPCSFSEYSGRLDYGAAQGTPGINADQ